MKCQMKIRQRFLALILSGVFAVGISPAAVIVAHADDGSSADIAESRTENFCGAETLTCTLEEHIHCDDCYTAEQLLVCKEMSEEHVHEEACYTSEQVLTCSKIEHKHDDACYQRELTCGLEEQEGHIHSEECYEWFACAPENAGEPVSEREDVITTYSDKTGSIEIESDGVTFTYSLNSDYTAECTAITVPQTAQKVTVPSSIAYDDETYSVTVLNLDTRFNPLKNVTALDLPDSLISLYGYYNLPDMTAFTIPGSIKVSTANFQGCTSLTTLTFAEGVEEIDCDDMVHGCAALKTVSLPSTLTLISSNYTFAKAAALQTINLPEGVNLTGIGTFENCSSLKSIELPASIASIPAYTFRNCYLEYESGLETVTTRGTITRIGEQAFSGCEWLKNIPDLSMVTEMGDSAFEKCMSLSFSGGILNLSSLKVIPSKAFYGAGCGFGNYPSVITQVVFSDELVSVGDYAFSGCLMLWKGLSFPQTLESIGENAFESIASAFGSSSTIVTIPDSVTSIGKQAFLGANVKEIYIGAGVDEISEKTFAYLWGQETSLEKITFDNSEDNVTVASDAIPDGVTVVWQRASIGSVGDTISAEENAMTLQAAVNAATDNTPVTIIISKDIRLSSSLSIPENKKVIITSEEGKSYTIIGDRNNNISDLITVNEGAEVTFRNVTISGACNSGSVIKTKGSTTLSADAVVTKSSIQAASQGVIDVDGRNASFNLDGGSVENNKISLTHSGVIRITGGASASIQSGIIQNNKVVLSGNSYVSSPGVLLYEDSTCTMSGGIISGNSAIRGSAIMLYSLNKSKQANFTLSGGTISGNSCTKMGMADAGGAIAVEGNAKFTMEGGLIDGNIGGNGAGVSVLDNGLLVNNGEFKPQFIMNGGTISNNIASVAGGGIYSFSNGVQLNAGSICGNQAKMGGGIYSEGNHTTYSTLYMKNAVITKNSSGDQGGGLWLCSTGDAKVYVTNGGAIYENVAAGAGDDVVSVQAFQSTDSSVTLANRLLGGGKVEWHKDGGIYRVDESLIYASTDKNAVRYTDGDSNPVGVKNNRSHLAVKAVADPTAFALAYKTAQLFITNNLSIDYGGGVAANGGIVIGEETDNLIQISVTKVWDHGQNTGEEPKTVTIKLMVGDTVMDTLVLDGTQTDQDGNWIGTFKELLPGLDYRVVEVALPGYSSETTGNLTSGFIVKNTYVPRTGALSVHKTVSGSGGNTSQEFPFTVTFTGKELAGSYSCTFSDSEETGTLELTNGTGTFKLKHDQTITITGLPAGVEFEISESDNNGYAVTSQMGTITGNAEIKGTIVADAVAEVIFNNYKSSGGGPSSSYTSVSVKKVWKLDDGGTAADFVTINLLRNGAVYDTVTLDSSNDWSFTWSRLNDSYIWTVEEIDVPEGFTVSINRASGNSFTITNDDETGDTPDTPDDPNTPAQPDKPNTPDNPDSPEDPNTPDDPSMPNGPEEPGLPQTGQRWWPVVLAIALGGTMLLAGVLDIRKNRYHGKHER